MRVFHADAVAAVDVILEPFKVGEDQFVERRVLVAVDGEIPALRVQPRVPSREKLCRNHANPRGARNRLHTQISFLLFIPQCRGDFSQIDVLREGLEKGNHNKDFLAQWRSFSSLNYFKPDQWKRR
jgi:hypothetical protein